MFEGSFFVYDGIYVVFDLGMDDKYLVCNFWQICQLLQVFIDQWLLINVYIDGCDQLFFMVVLELDEDEDELLFDGSFLEIFNCVVEVVDYLLCFGQFEWVMVCFCLDGLVCIYNEGYVGFCVLFLIELVYLQWCELYCLEMLIIDLFKLVLFVDDDCSEVLMMCVVDISGGGLVVIVVEDCLVFGLQKCYDGCCLELFDSSFINVLLVVCNMCVQKLFNGVEMKCVGLCFDVLLCGVDSVIQCYIFCIDCQCKVCRNGES